MKKLRRPLCLLRSFVKLTLYQLLAVMLLNHVAAAMPSFTQEVMDQKVTIQLSNQPIKIVLTQLGHIANIHFAYKSSVVQQNTPVTITASNERLGNVLDQLLKPLGLNYQVKGRQIILAQASGGASFSVEPANTEMETLADQSVSGTVSDEGGAKLPGVSILIKGTGRGTTSDANGHYEISVPDANAILVFSFVGYTSQEVAVNNRTSLDISLETDTKSLSEVVVVGYGTQKRSDLTGSISSVKADDVKNLPVRSVAEALQGRAAGVQVTRTDGSPGAGADIIIRGVGSIGGMAPLYIVDGVRMGTGNNFNLQDVESIEILKDASAAAIYGAQAAGGVVLVTTKRGTQMDKINIGFTSYVGVRQPKNLYSFLNTSDYFKAKQAFGVNTNGWGDPNTLPDTDWVKALFGNGKEQNYALSLSGASAKSNYYISANYQREDGIRLDNWFERFSFRANSDYKITKRLKFGETLLAWKTNSNPSQGGGVPFRSTPTMPVYDVNNTIGGWGTAGSFFAGANPAGNELVHHQLNKGYALEGNIYADWEIVNGLNFRTTLGASVVSGAAYDFREAFDFGSLENTVASLSRDLSTQQSLTANFVLTYGKTIGKHDFKLLAGYESYRQDVSTLHGEAQGFQVVTQSLELSTNPSSNKTWGGEYPQTRLLSQFGRINYTYGSKYLFTANIRRDGSDRFGPSNKFGVFPSASIGWNLSEEAFIQDNLSYVSTLKLRASYGKLGSTSSIPQYTYLASYGGNGGTNIHGLPDGTRAKGYALTAQLPNSNIKWETVNQTDIGLDAGFFRNRLNVTLDWYSRQTQDMIYQVPVPLSSGYDGSSVYTNIGQMSNKGVEAAVDYRGKAGDFTFSIGANASFNQNLVKKLDGTNNNPINDGSAGDYTESTVNRTEAGKPLAQFYGYVTQGIFASDAEVTALNQNAQEKAGAAGQSTDNIYYQAQSTGAGDLKFQDRNGDGRITVDDKTYIGNPWPKMTYGINLNLAWKGIDLTALFQGMQGVSIYNGNKYYTQFIVGDYNTTSEVFKTSFFNGNGLTDMPRAGFTDATGAYVRDPNANYSRISDYFVENGSYFKLRNLQVGYTIPGSLTERAKIANVRIYFQGQNLFTVTKYTGMDPEVYGSNGTTGRGIDHYNAYPRTRLYSLGLSVNF